MDIETLVREAGHMMKENPPHEVIHKEGLANFVTDRDVKIQKFLIRGLSELYPGCHFYGEEDTEGNDHTTKGVCFYIDPIDGTTNYIFGYNHSCVSVGMGVDGKIMAGYVYNPYTDELYTAKRGKGAWLNWRSLKARNAGIEEGIVSFGCARYNETHVDALFDICKELYLNSLSLREGGSAALDLCRVASGANVSYLELKLQPYDYAAASVIVEEAGCVIEQVDGSNITLDGPCSILGGTPKAVEQVREVCRRHL